MSDIEMEGDPQADAGDFSPLPPAEYVFKCEEAKLGETSTHRKKIDLTLVVDEGEFEGRKVWHTLTFIPKGDAGHGLTISCLKAFGLLDPEEPSRIRVNREDFEGRTARARTKIEEYQGKNRTKIERWISSEQPATAPSAPAVSKPAAAPKTAASVASRAKAPF